MENMTRVKGAGVALSEEEKVKESANYLHCLRRSYREGKPNPSQRHKVKYNNQLHPGKFGLDIKKVFLYSKNV